MVPPHSGRQGVELATPVVSDSWIANSNWVCPPHSIWHIEAMSSVRDVENLFDALENQGDVNKQELIVQGNARFVVRWETESSNLESNRSSFSHSPHSKTQTRSY
jgi:hypothetical protein